MHRTCTAQYGAFWGLCNIFRYFKNAFLRTNSLNFGIFIFSCFFSKISCHNLGIMLFSRCFYSTFSLCTSYTVLYNTLCNIWYVWHDFSLINFYFTSFTRDKAHNNLSHNGMIQYCIDRPYDRPYILVKQVRMVRVTTVVII